VPLRSLPLTGSTAGLLSPVGPSPLFILVFLFVGVPLAGIVFGTAAAAVSLPYVYRTGGWLFARESDGGRPDPAPLRHCYAGAALGTVQCYLFTLVLYAGTLVIPSGEAAFTVVVSQVAAAVLVGGGVLFVHRSAHLGRLWRPRLGEPHPSTVTHLAVFQVAFVSLALLAWTPLLTR
jgi:hypothetical protein